MPRPLLALAAALAAGCLVGGQADRGDAPLLCLLVGALLALAPMAARRRLAGSALLAAALGLGAALSVAE
ncbi:MAG TPA: hypothetical protein VLI67_06400, partial [Vicinamibacteria bacterium]|nr:hypothetical protein [Vicinamibacteria bacterium]